MCGITAEVHEENYAHKFVYFHRFSCFRNAMSTNTPTNGAVSGVTAPDADIGDLLRQATALNQAAMSNSGTNLAYKAGGVQEVCQVG